MYRAMSVRARFFSQPTYLFSIPRNAYYPQPRVTSCLVRFRLRRPEEYPELRGTPAEFCNFVNLVGVLPNAPVLLSSAGRIHQKLAALISSQAFLSRRKQLKNNCARIYGEEAVAAALRSIGLDDRIRAERLTMPQFVQVFNLLGASGPGGSLGQMVDGFARERAAPRPPRSERALEDSDDEDEEEEEEGPLRTASGARASRPTQWPEFDNGPEPSQRFEDPDDPSTWRDAKKGPQGPSRNAKGKGMPPRGSSGSGKGRGAPIRVQSTVLKDVPPR